MAACYFGIFSCFLPLIGFVMALIALPCGIVALRRRKKGTDYGAITGDIVRAKIVTRGQRDGKAFHNGRIVEIVERTQKRRWNPGSSACTLSSYGKPGFHISEP